jgi:putative spermidine/putrescine transport system permease protein
LDVGQHLDRRTRSVPAGLREQHRARRSDRHHPRNSRALCGQCSAHVAAPGVAPDRIHRLRRLAYLFLDTIGTTGLVTDWLKALGFNPYDHGFDLYKLGGVAIVYTYFQLPLMVLVITPALEGLRPAWREAASGLGARGWQYWRYVGGPVLFPSFLGGVLLLFGGSLSAYATAEALTSGSIALSPIQIGEFLNGNVIAGQQNVGKAIGLGMVVIIAVVMVFYVLLQRRASRWLR